MVYSSARHVAEQSTMIDPADFHESLIQARLSTDKAAQWLGVSSRTVERYRRQGAPLMAQRAIAIMSGDFPGWEGFQIFGKQMITPCGVAHRNQIENLEWFARLQWQRGYSAALKHSESHTRSTVVTFPRFRTEKAGSQ
jgi:hypothetical protein